jgi:L,D-transpeptidase YbiS
MDCVALTEYWINITLATQSLELYWGQTVCWRASVSTARRGAGEQQNSLCTPTGWHVIRAKIGEGCPAESVFVGRRPTGEVYSPDLAQRVPNRDWILSRILWLSGLEKGHNRSGGVDTMRRYIYIHGTPGSEPMRTPASHGCVRMHNVPLMTLFSRVSVGTKVYVA